MSLVLSEKFRSMPIAPQWSGRGEPSFPFSLMSVPEGRTGTATTSEEHVLKSFLSFYWESVNVTQQESEPGIPRKRLVNSVLFLQAKQIAEYSSPLNLSYYILSNCLLIYRDLKITTSTRNKIHI